MGQLKSAYELAMEKLQKQGSDEGSGLSPEQKSAIGELRKEHQARIAEREIMLAARIARLPERTPPEEIAAKRTELEEEHREEKRALEEELERRVQAVREQG
ncbi:MAG: hypothetical protein U0166_13000 [Acidobacteriota bacterium]